MKILAVEFNDDFLSISYVEDPTFLRSSPDSVVTRVLTVTAPASEAGEFLSEFLDDLEGFVDHLNTASALSLEEVEAIGQDDEDNDSMEIL